MLLRRIVKPRFKTTRLPAEIKEINQENIRTRATGAAAAMRCQRTTGRALMTTILDARNSQEIFPQQQHQAALGIRHPQLSCPLWKDAAMWAFTAVCELRSRWVAMSAALRIPFLGPFMSRRSGNEGAVKQPPRSLGSVLHTPRQGVSSYRPR